MRMRAIEAAGKTDPLFAGLAEIVKRHNMLWSLEAEQYLIANGTKMQERSMKQAADVQQAQDNYIKSVAGSGGSTADELDKLSKLHDAGKLTDAEFASQKAKLLG